MTLSSPIPTGWVMTRSQAGANYIRYVNNAPYGTEVEVMLASHIPVDWIMVRTYGTSNVIRRIG
ncbi:hypothetical protein P4V43_24295 [Brevibacillus fortis]|uniref:hypothetical protein n=1 Tax=Brevibacillus fortis TaxID=2126352 RepID=UPI0011B236D5|nr:hypothetical protein [Brevibacillus fortis]MED1784941.1 hypothetical protein [Brevibacillus fortis]